MKLPLSINMDELNFDQFLENGFIFQLPNCDIFWLGVLAVGSREDHDIYHANFYQSEYRFFKAESLFRANYATLETLIAKHLPQMMNLKKIGNMDEDYLSDVDTAIENIKTDEDLKKLVAVSVSEYERSLSHPIANFKRLSLLEGSVYGLWGNGLKNVLGVTPEPLFVRRGNSFFSVALAGTISTGEVDFEKTLLNDKKELNEHQFVVEDIENKISGSVDSFEVANSQVKHFGSMAHIETPISFISDKSSLAIVSALTPTAALGGYPSQTALNELKKLKYFHLEKDQRSFGGTYGFELSDAQFALVGIRNIYWDENTAWIHSGGGIVSSSVPKKELAEILRKRSSIEEVFSEE